MNNNEIMILFDYNRWGNCHLLEAARLVDGVQFVVPAPISHDSLRGSLAHVLSAEWVWRMRCQEGVSLSALLAEDFIAFLRQRLPPSTV